MRKTLIVVISGIMFLVCMVILVGIILRIAIATPRPNMDEKELIVKVKKKSIEQIYSYNNEACYVLWLHVNSISMTELNKGKYLGKIEWLGATPGTAYELDDRSGLRYLIYIGSCPKWWAIKTGYDVYQVEKSDRYHPPHYICMIFVSPDKKDIYIFQSKNTRSN